MSTAPVASVTDSTVWGGDGVEDLVPSHIDFDNWSVEEILESLEDLGIPTVFSGWDFTWDKDNVKRIGYGRFSKVYKVLLQQPLDDGTDVIAVKRYQDWTRNHLRVMVREALLLRKLSGCGFVECVAMVWFSDGTAGLGLQYVESSNLFHAMMSKRLGAASAPPVTQFDNLPGWDDTVDDMSLEERARIGAAVAGALAAAHARGVYHGDLKPANIILEHGTNRVFLADLGNGGYRAHTYLGLTTSSHRAPEVNGPVVLPACPDALVSPLLVVDKAEVFSLGIVLLELLMRETWSACWPNNVPDDRLLDQLAHDYPHARDSGYIDLVRACVHPHPHHRPTAAQAHAALLAVADTLAAIAAFSVPA